MTSPYYADDMATLYHGDCLDVLADLPDCSIDAVVTDPPYGLRFMGAAWDGADIVTATRTRQAQAAMPDDGKAGANGGYRSASTEAGRYDLSANAAFGLWCETWAQECLRVLKPGGHLVSFGGARTWHRLAAGIEDAGFEIRDSIAWLYGSGFPKSLNVESAIERVDQHEALDWRGWGTALKPAFEPIVVARKPLVGTVAANVLAFGTGALNIDGCRVGTDDVLTGSGSPPLKYAGANHRPFHDTAKSRGVNQHPAGRWPANVVLDESQADALDRQSGTTTSRIGKPRGAAAGDGWGMTATGAEYDDQGGASRFFPTFHYEAKAGASERPRYNKSVLRLRADLTPKQVDHVRARLAEAGVQVD